MIKKSNFKVIFIVAILLTISTLTATVLADDPLTVVNNLSDFMFSIIRALGVILLGFGIVQIGLSMKSQDPSQRSNGFMSFFGGVIIMFAKEILTLITGGSFTYGNNRKLRISIKYME